jgi:NitT/TauT family transport system substrate-binding protein
VGVPLTRSQSLALLAGALFARPSRSFAQSLTPVRIGYSASDIGSQGWYGKELGIFARAGIDAQLTVFNNSQAISNAAAAGAIDVGVADMIQLANGYIHGVPFGFFAGSGLYDTAAPTLELRVMKDSPYRKASDLEGQAVGVIALNSISSLSVQEWVRVNGGDVAKVKIFETPFPTMLPGLERGTIAAALIAEPFLTSSYPATRLLAKTYDTVARQFYVTAWFASRDWLKRSPDVTRNFTSAVYETARWLNARHPESATMLATLTKLPLENIRTMRRAVFGTSLDPKLMQPVLDIGARYKAIERPVNAADLIGTGAP